MRPAANPIQRAMQEIDLDIKRKEKEVAKMQAARKALDGIMTDLKLNGHVPTKRSSKRGRRKIKAIKV